MTERAVAAEEKPASTCPRDNGVRAGPGTAAQTALSLQRCAGNAAVNRLLDASRPPRPGLVVEGSGRLLHRCVPETYGCGKAPCDDELAPLLRQAVAARTLARQHDPGGPYHPPEGTPMACTMADSCAAISTKINYLRHTIKRHEEWDIANPDPRWPGGRHALEIADLQRALANCIQIASIRCRGQPRWIPVPETAPEETPQERAERVRRQLYEALPWAVAVLVVALVVACVIAEPCGAAVLAAVAAVGGSEAVAVVTAILIANGVMTEDSGA